MISNAPWVDVSFVPSFPSRGQQWVLSLCRVKLTAQVLALPKVSDLELRGQSGVYVPAEP